MSYSIWGALAETNWWVYVFFLWLAAISFQATKPHKVSMKLTIVYPLLLLALLLMLLPFVIPLTLYKLFILILFITPGFVFGYLQFRFQRIKAIKATSQFYVPGSFSLFIILMLLLIAKFYYYNYAVTFNFSSLKQETTTNIVSAVSGFIIGLYIARSLCLYRCMKIGPYQP